MGQFQVRIEPKRAEIVADRRVLGLTSAAATPEAGSLARLFAPRRHRLPRSTRTLLRPALVPRSPLPPFCPSRDSRDLLAS